MDNHVILNILLNYYTDMENWYNTRLLNKSFKKLVDEQKYKKNIYGRRTFIMPNFCEICEKIKSNVKMQIYRSDNIAQKRIITHCPNWFCNISSLYSMINHYKVENIYLLREPFQPKKKIIIPRSDGSETIGICKKNCLLKKDDKWFIFTSWYDEMETYTKVIPLSHYTNDFPKIIFEFLKN